MHTRIWPLQSFQYLWKQLMLHAFAWFITAVRRKLWWRILFVFNNEWWEISVWICHMSLCVLKRILIFLCVIGLSDVRAVCCYRQLQMSHMTRIICTVNGCDLTFCHGLSLSLSIQRETPLQMQYFPSEGRLDKSYFPYYGKKAQVSTTHIGCCAPMYCILFYAHCFEQF